MLKSKGPKMDPWGTPLNSFSQVLVKVPSLTC